MKPCASNRKLIVWQTLHALDAQQTRLLQAHLETCAGCRRYLTEISNLTEGLVTVETNPDILASESFHRKVAQKLRAAKPDSWREIVAANFQRMAWNWRVAVPVVAALALIGVMLASWPQPSQVAAHRPAEPSVMFTSGSDTDVAPTIANYQRTADQSLEKFDALLTRQSKRALPTTPSYTASTRSLANESF
jgi:hypothetical protein